MNIYCDSSTMEYCIVPEGGHPHLFSHDPCPVTNNVGEYKAVLFTITLALALKETEFTILSDSQLVVNQVRGYQDDGTPWRKCASHLKPYRDKIRELINLPGSKIELKWIPREENLAGKVLE